MERKRAFKLIAASTAALSLQGCIAAAFPLAAGGLLAGGGRTQAEPEAAIAAAPAAEAPDAASAALMAESAASKPAPTPAPAPAPATDPAPDPVSAPPVQREVGLAATDAQDAAPFETAFPPAATSEVPTATVAASDQATNAPRASANPPEARTSSSAATSMVVPVPAAQPFVAGGTFFDPLFAYASASKFARSDARTSAILRNPAMLDPERIECVQGVSTILIDLDPDEGELLPVDPNSASPAFAQRLAQLRQRGLKIAWISQNPIEKADEIQIALFRSGLDPQGTDQLLLMRSGDDRKQARRDELARNSCLIAIAGDARSDFHELFGYLLNPGDAAALQPLMGEGWFLIPTPLLPERPTR